MNHGMGTVEKIVEVLNNMCSDKKSQATTRYTDHSTWLSGEFMSIRLLINPEGVSSTLSTTAASRQKRKSPETCSSGSRNSPQYKRNSSDCDVTELLVAQGLPSDLNKLKKDQLLKEINARGCEDMTMKALKKDMVEMLKSLVVDIHKRTVPTIPEELVTDKQSQEDVTVESNDHVVKVEDVHVEEEVAHVEEAVVEVSEVSQHEADSVDLDKEEEVSNEPEQEVVNEVSVDTEVQEEVVKDNENDTTVEQPKPDILSPRKQSILSEYRQQINSSTVGTSVRTSVAARSQIGNESKEDRDARVQSEFEARKLRHRMSQIGRKSDGSANSANSGIVKTDNDEEEKETTVPEATSTSVSKSDTKDESEELPLQSLMQTATCAQPANLNVDLMDTEDDDDSNWNEVPSPKKNGEEASQTSTESSLDKKKISPQSEVAAPVVKQPIQKQTVEKLPAKVDLPTTKTVKSENAAPSQLKKPSNLVGGNQLSFLSSTKSSTTSSNTNNKPKTAVSA